MNKIQKIARTFKISLANYDSLSMLLAYLKAALHVHQTHHWQTSGKSYYADHLLFERIYDESEDFVDELAEKAVGLGSIELVDCLKQSELVHEIITSICKSTKDSPDEMVAKSLAVEEALLELVKKTIDNLEYDDKLSHGISNLLEGIADKHETFVYLLKQRNEKL